LIGLWGIAENLERGANAVYLVTHRALAQQKLEDFKEQLLSDFIEGDAAKLVLATGDYVIDALGEPCSDPLGARMLVATYEKYLALLSASGIPSDMKNTVIVCDEIQIIADETRGQSVEILLSLLRKIGWCQFIGLSAVLDIKDAKELSDWLGVELLHAPGREKHIQYNCISPAGIFSVETAHPESNPIPQQNNAIPRETVGLVKYLIAKEPSRLPIIVFCMAVKDTYALAEKLFGTPSQKDQLALDFDDLPKTFANEFLSKTLTKRIAIHNADLTDEERKAVEAKLLAKEVDVVFATSTLAAGVNFPLASAVFASYARWNFERKTYIPIDPAEFHNMAGRVGRMGYDGLGGKVFYFSGSTGETIAALRYLDFDSMSTIKSRVTPDRFNLLALQLISSGLCSTESEVEQLILGTFSALRELENNPKSHSSWPLKISNAVNELVDHRYLLKADSGNLAATATGKAVGLSGLTPETSTYILKYLCCKLKTLIDCLPGENQQGNPEKLVFLLFSAAFSTPEFVPMNGKKSTRLLHYTLDGAPLFNTQKYISDLSEKVWQANIKPMNATSICLGWIEGKSLRDIERLLPNLRAGAIRETIRNLSWVLQGISSILTSVTDKRNPKGLLPKVVSDSDTNLDELSKLPRVIKRLMSRLALGLPDDAIWLNELNLDSEKFKISRDEILTFSQAGRATPQFIMLGTQEADEFRRNAFEKFKPSPILKANWLRDACREWKKNARKKAAARQLKRAAKCPSAHLIKQYYEALGDDFETAFENVLAHLSIEFDKIDADKKTGAPDYLVKIQDSPGLIFELKSKQGDKLVDYNSATEVLAASEIHGFKDHHCLTLCHPGVDPSVPMAISSCARLTVIESHDLAEALLRVCEGKLSHAQLWQWLATPGQALSDDLPFVEYY
jgi:helicase